MIYFYQYYVRNLFIFNQAVRKNEYLILKIENMFFIFYFSGLQIKCSGEFENTIYEYKI